MLAIRSAEATKGHRHSMNGHMQSPPNTYARIPENAQTSIPHPVKTSVQQENMGQYANNYNTGHYSHPDYQSNSNNSSPVVYRSPPTSSSNENQNYRHNPYDNPQDYPSNQQTSPTYTRSSQLISPNSLRRHDQYSAQSPNSVSQQSGYRQYSPSNGGQQPSPGQRPESKYNQLSPTSLQNRYSQAPNTFQYSSPKSPGSPNVNYRVKPPPVKTSPYPYELNPESSPNSPLTPKTPTPGYYQSGPVYSPTYGGYSTGSNSPNGPITPVSNNPQESMEDEISRVSFSVKYKEFIIYFKCKLK